MNPPKNADERGQKTKRKAQRTKDPTLIRHDYRENDGDCRVRYRRVFCNLCDYLVLTVSAFIGVYRRFH